MFFGGSATIDAGIGCAQACGLPVILEGGEPTSLSEPLCGRDVARVVLVKHARGDKLGGVEFLVASDVTNPLYGDNGAARRRARRVRLSRSSIQRCDRSRSASGKTTSPSCPARAPPADSVSG